VVPPQRASGGNSTSVEAAVGHLAAPAAVTAAVLGLVLVVVATVRLRRRLQARGLEPAPVSRWLTAWQLTKVSGGSLVVALLSWLAA
jgi:hypothetical protein